MATASCTLHRTFLALFSVMAMAATASAGSVYVWVVADPPSTAGAGVAPIAGGGSNMVVSSSRSGLGTFHVYAVDDTDGSAGFRSFFVKLNGSVSGVLNRSPNTQWDDDPSFGNGSGPFVAGFDGARTTTPLLGGSQSPTDNPQIAGFGIAASNFQAKTNAASYISTPTSGRWGVYALGEGITSGIIGNTGHFRSAILLGEGNYTGAPPTVDVTTSFAGGGTGFNSWIANGFPGAGSFTTAVGTVNTVKDFDPWLDPEPATLTLVCLAVVGFGGLVGRRRN